MIPPKLYDPIIRIPIVRIPIIPRIRARKTADARTDARTHGRRIEGLPARAYREHRLFQLGTPSVAFAKYPWPESGRATDAPVRGPQRKVHS